MSAEVDRSHNAACPSCGNSVDVEVGDGWSTPSANGSVSQDGERYRIEWWTPTRIRKVALFRVVTDDRVSVLQHIRSIRVSQRVEERISHLDEAPQLADIPREWRALMRADGFTPAVEESA